MKQLDENKPCIFINLLDDYLKQLIPVEGCSENTVKSYKDCFALLFAFLEDVMGITSDKVSFSTLSNSVITSFLDWLENSRHCSVTTRNQRKAALTSFAKYSVKVNYRAASSFYSDIIKVPQKRGGSKKRSFFTLVELQTIFSLPKLNTLAGRRDSILLITMYYTGARAQEICDLRVKDISFLSNGSAKVTLHGKGNKTRTIPIPSMVAQKLDSYLKYQGIKNRKENFVFCSQTHEQMSISCVEEIYKKYIKIAKSNHPDMFNDGNYSPHSMRHTTAVHMLEAGVSLPKIQRFLGHSSIATTQIYAEITQKSLDKAMTDWSEKTWGNFEEAQPEQKALSERHGRRPSFLK